MRPALLHTALFLLGLLATAVLVQQLDAMPYFGWTRPKCVHYLANADRYDTLILGSSRMHCGLVPRTFDARMAELGRPSCTFNLAFSGMEPHDYSGLGLWLMQRRSPALRRVVVELSAWNPRDVGSNWLADMQIQTHTLRQLLPRLVTVWRCNTTFADHLTKGRAVLAHTLVNCLHVGQGPRLVDDLLCEAIGDALPGSSPVADGGVVDVAVVVEQPVPDDHDDHDERMDPRSVRWRIDFKRRNTLLPSLRGGFNFEAWRDLDDEFRRAGIEPVYVVMPVLGLGFQGRDAVDQIAAHANVIDFDRPDLYPELFEPDLYYDIHHLNKRGAEVLSHRLADRLADASKPAPEPHSPPPPPQVRFEVHRPEAGSPRLTLRADNVPDVGVMLAVISATTTDVDLGYGMRAKVALPGLQSVYMPRTGLGTAEAVIDTDGLPAGRPLYVQGAVYLEGNVLCVTELVTIDD